MYEIYQAHREYSRLATGPGGLKPIWILVPVMVRTVTEGYRFPGRYRLVSEHRASRVRCAESVYSGIRAISHRNEVKMSDL